MGQPAVHFDITSVDGARLGRFYRALFGWDIDTDNPLRYGAVAREDNTNPDGIGIGGGSAPPSRAAPAT